MKILGIDLAGSEKRKTGVCVLNEQLKADCFCVFGDKEILKIIEKEKPKLIAIDAPLSLPKGRKSLKRKSKIHFRECDRELWKFKIKFLPITLGPMRTLTERGMRLKKILEKKFKVIEVYPGATQDILKIPRKQKGLRKLKKGLEKLGIKISNKNPNADELDAITCAFTGWFFIKRKFLAVGNKKEGKIILPKIQNSNIVKFCNCEIDVSLKVFRPRPETEFWVKKAIKDCRLQIANWKLKKVTVLDIFAGSGCIGIAILKNLRDCKVDFVDIDKMAIDQIKINLRLNDISKERYRIYHSKLFEKLKEKKYDFIFANPPYVAKERIWQVQDSVKKIEPKISWYGGKRGMRYIKKFLKEAKNYLKEKGIIYLEFDPLQKEEIKNILEKYNYSKFKFYKDQFKKFRWLKIEEVRRQS